MHPGTPPRHSFGKPAASSLGRGNGLPQSVSLYRGGDPLHRGAKSSMRWVCGHGSCQKLVSSQLDGRGHYQSTHLSRQVTSPLCSCGITFSSCTTLANHLDIQHNIHHAGVSRRVPTIYLIYLDWPALPPTTSPTPPKCKRKC